MHAGLASAPVGSTFSLIFTVFTSGSPASSASVQRTLQVVGPCPTGQQLCGTQCTPVPCALAGLLIQSNAPPPPALGSPNVTLELQASPLR
jgi:hypothetical protein